MITENNIIQTLVEDAASCYPIPDGVVVSTQCLYPSGEHVQVDIIGRGRYSVTDRGRAISNLESHNVILSSPARSISPFAKKYDLSVSNGGVVFISEVSIAEIPYAITLVANASKDAATIILDKHKFKPKENITDTLERMLRPVFEYRLTRNMSIAGASNKQHRFDFGVERKVGGYVLLSCAANDIRSVNSAVVSCLDVRLAKHELSVPRIVYDQRDEWRAENLSLLEEGAPTIELMSAREAISELANVA